MNLLSCQTSDNSHFMVIRLLKMPDQFYMFLLRESMRETLRWSQRGSIAQVIKLILCWYILLISDSHHCWALSCGTHKHSPLSISPLSIVSLQSLILSSWLFPGPLSKNWPESLNHPLVSLLRGDVTGLRGQTQDRRHQKMKFHFHQSCQSSKVCHGEWWWLAANK